MTRLLALIGAALLLGCSFAARDPVATDAPAADAAARQALATLSVPFVPSPDESSFSARTFGVSLTVTSEGRMVYALPSAEGSVRLTESLVDAAAAELRGEGRSPTQVSIFRGDDPARWRRRVPTYRRVSLGEVYPGIELTLHTRDGSVEKIFDVAPGADPGRIHLALAGAEEWHLTSAGELAVRTGVGDVHFAAPVAFQPLPDGRRPVQVAYRLEGQGYRFELGDYDPALPLLIDPDFGFAPYKPNPSAIRATFLGGNHTETIGDMARDAQGNLYVVGSTQSPDFPIEGSSDDGSLAGGADAFLVRLSPDLSTILGATYLGGGESDGARGLVLAPTGEVYVVGRTKSSNFPRPGSEADGSFDGTSEAFIARLSADLGNLEKATFVGGSGMDWGNAIALDSLGRVYAAGFTQSPDLPGIGPGSADDTFGGNSEQYVVRLDADLGTIEAATYVGGSDSEASILRTGLLVHGNAVYTSGNTSSMDFPGVDPQSADPFFNGQNEGFIAKLDLDLSELVAATFLGGSGFGENPTELARSASGFLYAAGDLEQEGLAFPPSAVLPGFENGGGADFLAEKKEGFVAILGEDLNTAVLAATFIGGIGDDAVRALAIDAAGRVWVGGDAEYSADSPLQGWGCKRDGEFPFVAVLSFDLSEVLASECPGPGKGEVNALAFTASGVFAAGSVRSAGFLSFQIFIGAADSSFGGLTEGFVAEFDLGLPAQMVLKFDDLATILLFCCKSLSLDSRQQLLDGLDFGRTLGEADLDRTAIARLEGLVRDIDALVEAGELTGGDGRILVGDIDEIIDGLAENLPGRLPPSRR